MDALSEGSHLDPTKLPNAGTQNPALVALMGECRKFVNPAGAIVADVSYVLVSNKTCSDPNPIGGAVQCNVGVVYPWFPGRWYDLPVVMSQNFSTDLDDYIRKWHSQRWLDAGGNATAVSSAMAYYFPYWCGWGYWWWWWNSGNCTAIGIGEGESINVNQIVPSRVFMTWPPPP